MNVVQLHVLVFAFIIQTATFCFYKITVIIIYSYLVRQSLQLFVKIKCQNKARYLLIHDILLLLPTSDGIHNVHV